MNESSYGRRLLDVRKGAGVMAPPYLRLLAQIHEYLQPRTYVEIGVARGRSFACALPGTLAVGIDPRLALHQPVNRSAKFFPVTSDEFFEENDLGDVLGGLPVDLTFIDGMHLFEFALRDFMNLEKFCGSTSTILIHDCYPIDAETAVRKPKRGGWTGDIWKLIICLKRYRPDLEVAVVQVATGVGIVTGLNAESTVLSDHYEEICTEFVPLGYELLEQDKDQKLNGVPNDWQVVQDLLPGPFAG